MKDPILRIEGKKKENLHNFLRAKTISRRFQLRPLLVVAIVLFFSPPILTAALEVPYCRHFALPHPSLRSLIATLTLRLEFQHACTRTPLPLQAQGERELGEKGKGGNRRLLYPRRTGNFTRGPLHLQEGCSEEG